MIPETNRTKSTDNQRKRIRVGIIGAGLMGKWHARAVNKAGGKLVAVTDIDSQKGKRFIKGFQAIQIYNSVEIMLEKETFDVIHICTPLATHKNLVESTIKAGINALIEKPLACNAAETIELYNLAAQYSVQICPVHQFAFQYSIKKAKKLLELIGEITHLESTICSAGAVYLPPDQLNFVSGDILPHPLSLFQTFLSYQLPMNNWQVMQPQAGEFRVFGIVHNISLAIFIGLQTRPTANIFRICGTQGTIYIDLFHGFTFFESGEVSKFQKIMQPFKFNSGRFMSAGLNLLRRAYQFEIAYPGLQDLVSRFYQSIEKHVEPPVTSAQAIEIATVRDLLIKEI